MASCVPSGSSKKKITFTYPPTKVTWTYGKPQNFMTRMTPTRDLIAGELKLSAYPSGLLKCKLGLIRSRVMLPARVTVMLALTGPNGDLWRVFIGDDAGGLALFSLPNLIEVRSWHSHAHPVRSLTAKRRHGGLTLLSGDEAGNIFVHGEHIPSNSLELFNVNGPVSAIRCVEDAIHINVGWDRHILHWNGEKVGERPPMRNKKYNKINAKIHYNNSLQQSKLSTPLT